MRDVALGQAARIVCPSAAFRELSLGWGVRPEVVTVIPNPVSMPAELADRELLRRRYGLSGPTLAFAGRLVPQKALGIGLEALARSDGVTLVIAGDGVERDQLERKAKELALDGRVRFLGTRPRSTVFELLRAADAAFLPSSWENFPHMVVEALAVGTPVIATETGGVGEVVIDGVNGLLVAPNQSEAFAAAIARYFGDGQLRRRLRESAAPSAERFAPEAIYGRLEEILREAAGRE